MSNNFASFLYFVIYAACTYACAFFLYSFFELNLWISTLAALAVSWLPTLILAFILWPPLAMLLSLIGVHGADEGEKPASQGHNYVIDTKTGEQVHSDDEKKDQ